MITPFNLSPTQMKSLLAVARGDAPADLLLTGRKLVDVLSLRVFVMLSSCVPATHMETSGAQLAAQDLAALINEPRVLGVAEMMNYPGVVGGADDMVAKALLGHNARLRVDGHAPMVSG